MWFAIWRANLYLRMMVQMSSSNAQTMVRTPNKQINSVCAHWHSSNHFIFIMSKWLSIAICRMTAAGPAHRITEEAAIGPNGHLHWIIEEAGHMHRKSTRWVKRFQGFRLTSVIYCSGAYAVRAAVAYEENSRSNQCCNGKHKTAATTPIVRLFSF